MSTLVANEVARVFAMLGGCPREVLGYGIARKRRTQLDNSPLLSRTHEKIT